MSSYLPLLVMCGGLTAFLARNKSRNPIPWFFIGLFTGPVGLIFIMALSDA